METVVLNTGAKMPILGLGVYQSPPGKETENAVKWALEEGYRHIDTAAVYRNERDVGNAIRASGIKREEIFLTTKLWTSDHGYESALKGFEASRKALGVDYLDLYLIHWPTERKRLDSWKALVKLQKDGVCRAIGVSNYLTRHLDEIAKHSDVVPAVNQVEFSPFLYQKDLLEYCRAKGIQLEAYSPLTQGEKLRDPMLVKTAAKYKKSPAQLLIRWAIEHSIVVIPKSVRQARIRENARVFDFKIDSDDMKYLDGLNEDLRVCWNPTNVP